MFGLTVEVKLMTSAKSRFTLTACAMSQSCETNWIEHMTGHGGWQCSIGKGVKFRKKKFENLLLLLLLLLFLLLPSSCLRNLYLVLH